MHASRELLDECSCLLSTRAIREHKGDSCSYDHRAFARRHDDDIAVLPCTLGEPVCEDERANDGDGIFMKVFLNHVSKWCGSYEGDENQIKEAFINGGRGHPPSHLKFFLLVFSKLKEDIK